MSAWSTDRFRGPRWIRHFLQGACAALLACLALPTLATTYTFTSPNYSSAIPFTPPCTIGTCANFTTSMHFGGTFTTAAPLAANLVNADVRAQVTSFSFNDGLHTYASSDAQVRLIDLELSTDATGVPIPNQTFIDIVQWQSGTAPHANGSRFNEIFVDFNADAFNDRGCTTVGTKNGVADACATTAPTDSNQSEASNSVAGTWVVTSGGGPAATATTLTSSTNPANAGQTIVLTATVTGNAPTGTVQFMDGTNNLGSPVALTSSAATLSTSSLAVGTHPLKAVYGGDTNNAGSTSLVLNEVVNAVVVTTPQAIPTLSEAMLGMLAGLIVIFAAVRSRRMIRTR